MFTYVIILIKSFQHKTQTVIYGADGNSLIKTKLYEDDNNNHIMRVCG